MNWKFVLFSQAPIVLAPFLLLWTSIVVLLYIVFVVIYLV